MIECYYGDCPNHINKVEPDSGPFCNLNECIALPDQLELFEKNRKLYLSTINFKVKNDQVLP